MATEMEALGQRARAAARVLALSPGSQRNAALAAMASALRSHANAILAANAQDVAAAQAKGVKEAFLDRLTLTPPRVEAMAHGVAEIAALPDPVGRVLAQWTRPNGLEMARVSVPIGVIGIIFESRPNVTADAGALCVKSGNAVILRGGSDSLQSALAIGQALQQGLAAAGLPADAIQIVPTADRAAVGEMLQGLGGTVDVLVPRGGKSLVARVQQEARVPVFSHLEGNCHTYVDRDADLAMAARVVLNAKMRRTGVCGATETVLVDKAIAAAALPRLVATLAEAGCEIRGDAATQAVDARVVPATEDDWSTEFLDAIVAMRVVDGVDAAMDHIARYGSQHTEAIITGNEKTAARFLATVDSAIVLHNASTQFADGGEFGFGAEIGIATGKLHARGPVGVEQLTTFKYQVRGTGQTRP